MIKLKQSIMNSNKDYLITFKEAAFVLGYKSPRSLYRLIEEGFLSTYSSSKRQNYFKLSEVMSIAKPQTANFSEQS